MNLPDLGRGRQVRLRLVRPSDPRARGVKSIEVLKQVGDVDSPTGADENLLISGDSGDAPRSGY